MKNMNTHNEGLQRGFGCIGVLIQVGLIVTDYAEPDDLFLSPIYFVFALLFMATALSAFFGPLQAALFFGLTAVETLSSLNSFYGLGFALAAVVILSRRGWFFRWPMIKAAIVAAVGCVSLIAPVAASDQSPINLVPAFISASIYTFLVFGLARSRFLSALAPKKPMFRLADYKLSKRESQVVKARLQGKTVKELAIENGLAVSTVRNTIANACHKLDIEGLEALITLGERFRVE
jgi:DNA-binding CsgD family transcriptional regulator